MPAQGEAIARQLEELHASSWGWALACAGRDRDVAADVLQQAYWKVLEGRARFDGRSQLKTWFFGVIRVTAMEQRRWRLFQKRETAAIEDLPAPSGPKVDRETAEALARALAKVSERQREVLHLVFYEGLTVEEASNVMAVSVGTARQHYERGKAALLDILTKEGVRFP